MIDWTLLAGRDYDGDSTADPDDDGGGLADVIELHQELTYPQAAEKMAEVLGTVPITEVIKALSDAAPFDNGKLLKGFLDPYTQEMARLEIRDVASKAYARKKAAESAQPFDIVLAETIPDVETKYSIEEVWPTDGNVLLIAPFKAGKTSLLLNTVRARCTGTDFLGRFATTPIEGRVAFLNYELPPAQFGRWVRNMDMPEDKLLAVNLRGRRNPLAVPDDMKRLGEALQAQNVEVLFIDPLSKAFTGDNQNDNTQMGNWWQMVQEWTTTYGIREFAVAAHAGRQGEHARGASSLEGDADSIWTMTKDSNARYFKALGREVLVEDDALIFDPETMVMTLAGTGGRSESELTAWFDLVKAVAIDAITAHPGINVTGLREQLKGAGHGAKSERVSALSRHGEALGWWEVSSPSAGSRQRNHRIDPDASELPSYLRPSS